MRWLLEEGHRIYWMWKVGQLDYEESTEDMNILTIQRLALKAHREASQHVDLLRDLAQRLKPSDGPFNAGDQIWYWDAKPRKPGQPAVEKFIWKKGKVLAHEGPMVTVETASQVARTNQAKIRLNHDPWHDIPLPRQLEETAARD